MMFHLILTLQAPMMSFGRVQIDQIGPTWKFPSSSMLTGLMGNALGYDRDQHRELQSLQDRLVHASRLDEANERRLIDYQTVSIQRGQAAWTPMGNPETRGGGTYQNHQRWREYLQDARVTTALRLEPADESPTCQEIADALIKPERPLFIGRKNCIPATRILAGWQEAETVLEALILWPADSDWARGEDTDASWPLGEGAQGVIPNRQHAIQDLKNWRQGVHGGERIILEGKIPRGVTPETPGKD